MTADTPTPTPPEPEPEPEPVAPPVDPPPAGLYRSSGDRMLAGVCGGIAERYGIDAVIVRLAFLATLLIGGAGVLFYIAAAIVIPNPPADADGPLSPAGTPPTSVGNGILRILVTLAVVLAVFCGLLTVAVVAFAVTVLFGPWPAAIGLVVLGALLAAVASNRRSAATVLVLIVAIAVPAAAAAIADLSVDRSVGERTETPLIAEDAAQGYRLGLGSLTVDLRELPLRAGSPPLAIPIRVDVGRNAIVIPHDRCVAWTIRSTFGLGGDIRVLDRGRGEASIGVDQTRTFRINPGGGARRPQVTIDAHVGVGELVVGHTISQIERHRGGDGDVRAAIRTDACRGEDARRP